MVNIEAKTVKFWPVPSKGVWRHVPIYQIPDDALYDSHNVVEIDGRLVPRPGMTSFTADDFAGDPCGATMYYKTKGQPVIVYMTSGRIYTYNATTGVWTDRTGAAITGTAVAANKARFTSIVLGNTTATSYVIMTNGIDPPQKWDGTAAATSSVAGTPPLWTDVATIADRIIGIDPPYNVSWSPVRQIDSWPALNYHQAGFTPDQVVAIRALGVQGGVLYKARSIWTISPTGLDSDAKAYRFDLYGLYEGPANPAAVVDADGVQVRMTPTGRIGVFDGAKHSWIGDGVWPIIRAQMDPAWVKHIHGVYDPLENIVYMFYPLSNGAVRGVVMITLPQVGREGFGCFLGEYTLDGGIGGLNEILASVTFTQKPGATTAYKQLVFTGGDPSATHGVYSLEGTLDQTDSDSVIAGYWQTGLAKLPEAMRLEGIELYASRGDGYGNLTVEPVTSWVLADDGQLGTARTIDLGQAIEPPRDPLGFDQRARFAGLRFSFGDVEETTLEYKGVALLGQKVVG